MDYLKVSNWEWLFQSILPIEMWTEDYYKLLSIIGDDYE